MAVAVIPISMAAAVVSSTTSYHNITLSSPTISARVFMPMPGGNGDNKEQYYKGSRFEHGSMIGDITYKEGDRQVYGRSLWRTPHDPTNPESGVGLASEFGCGDNGSMCAGKGDITNGVLGYDTAKPGEPFLKIGVGRLIKGSCWDCSGDIGESYKFNSPYKFHKSPSWKVLSSPDPNEVTFVSEETLGEFGYRLQKTIRLDGDVLTVRSLLTNLGKKQFTTPWYSHHFFSGDNDPIGPGYAVDLGLSEYGFWGTKRPAPTFSQPGFNTWSGDINEYANVTMAGSDGSISMDIKKHIPEGVKLKADFLDESTQTLTDGSFTLHAPNGVSVYEKIPELSTSSRNPFIYAYNFYAERGTLSPEPMLLLYLQPSETTFWTQHLKFSSVDKSSTGSASILRMSIWSITFKLWNNPFNSSGSMVAIAVCCLGLVVASYIRFVGGLASSRRSRLEYESIPDCHLEEEEEARDVVLSVI